MNPLEKFNGDPDVPHRFLAQYSVYMGLQSYFIFNLLKGRAALWPTSFFTKTALP